ncbi:integrase [Tanacetum coccineum]
MEEVLEEQPEDLVEVRENMQSDNIHAENMHMENHVEPPVIEQEIEEGRPKRQRTQPRHLSDYQGKKAIDLKWVYKIKFKPNGEVERYKARLVTKGFTQRDGVDYHDTFAPVAKLVTLRTLLAIVVKRRWGIEQLDVNNAFLHGNLKEDVYMRITQRFLTKDETRVYKLKRLIYDLKQASRNCEATKKSLQNPLVGLGCRPSLFPMEPNLKLDNGEEEEKIDASRYRRLVGTHDVFIWKLQTEFCDTLRLPLVKASFYQTPRRLSLWLIVMPIGLDVHLVDDKGVNGNTIYDRGKIKELMGVSGVSDNDNDFQYSPSSWANPETNRDKFKPRGKPGVFLGYPPGKKGYKIYDLEQRKMVMTREARFIEEMFPFLKAEPKGFEQEVFEYSSSISQYDEPHEELAKNMENNEE